MARDARRRAVRLVSSLSQPDARSAVSQWARRGSIVRLLTALMAAPALAPSAMAADDVWIEIQSPHFKVVTDQGERSARRVALELERIRVLIAAALPDGVSDPTGERPSPRQDSRHDVPRPSP